MDNATKISDFVSRHLDQLLEDRRVVVWYDPKQECAALFDGFERVGVVKVDARRSSLAARRKADATWPDLVDPVRSVPRAASLLIYVPWPRAVAEDGLVHEPFEAFARAGEAFGSEADQSLQSLARRAMPLHAAEIDKLFATSPAVSLAQLEALGDRAGFPLLKKALGTDDPIEVGGRVLAEPAAVEVALVAAGVRADLKRLLADAFGFVVPTDAARWRAEFARWVLFSEFAFDVKDDVPAHTSKVRRADVSYERAIYTLCDRMRRDDDWRDEYMQLAMTVEGELQLQELGNTPGYWGVRDTFLAEDKATLLWVQAQCSAGHLASAREALDLRKKSIWLRTETRGQLWQLATRSLELLEAVASWRSRAVAATSSPADHVLAYASPEHGLWRVDRCQRWMERAVVDCADLDQLQALLDLARTAHRDAAGAAQTAFLEAVQREGWPPSGPKQVEVYSRHVAPALAQGARVAYFLLDALRFEMGRDLGESLGKLGEVTIEAARTVVPTTTPFGMAALLPGAETSFGCMIHGGELVPTVAGKPIPDVNARKASFRELLGDRYRDVRLDDLQEANEPKLREMIGKADLVVVRSDDIDKAGEGTNSPSARRFMSSILDDVIRVAERLARAGVTRMVFVADHGHVLIPEIAPGDVVREPPGEWPAAKRRCRLGRAAGTTDGVIVVKAGHLGVHGPVDDIAIATGFRVFTKGAAYFHEGVSLQECLVPVVTLLARAGRPAGSTNLVAVTYRHPRFSQRVFIVKLKLSSVELSELDVRVTAVAPGVARPVGQAADCEARDPGTGLIRLRVGVEEAVAMRIDEAFAGPEAEIRVLDAGGAGVLLGSLKLNNGCLD